MELDIWSGDWGLASVDFACLQTLAAIKFAGVPVKVNKTNNPFWAPGGRLPVFRHYRHQLSSFHDIVTYLRSKNYNTDPGLNEKQLSEVTAYETMLRDKLYPALLCVMWAENKNYADVIRPLYAKMLPFPLNYYYPGHYRKTNTDTVLSLYPYLEEEEIKKKVYSEAEKCLERVSKRLGNTDFFYGDTPSSLDALVFGYISPLLKIPFPSNALYNYLQSSSNLVRFVVRITQRYFTADYQDYEMKRQKESEKSPQKDVVFPNKTRNQILAATFASVAMISYALVNGIFSISVNDSPRYDEIEYEVQDETA